MNAHRHIYRTRAEREAFERYQGLLRAASEAVVELERQVDPLRSERDRLVLEALGAGVRPSHVAHACGLSPQRVDQLMRER